jgi:hypothetical protein
VNRPATLSISSSPPTMSAPAATGLLRLLPVGEDQDPRGLAGAVRQVDGAAHHLVGLAGVDAEPKATSTVASNFVGWSPWPGDRLERGVELAAVDLLGAALGSPCCAS